MTRGVVVAMLVVVAATPARAQSGAPLTLDDAVATAVAHNRRVANANLEVNKAEADVQSVRSGRLPQFAVETQLSQLLRPVDVRFPQGAFGVYPGIGPMPAADSVVRTPAGPAMLFNAQVTQPLTGLHRINLDARLSEASLALEREVARSAKLTVIYDVKRLYYALVRSTSAIAAADHSLTMLRELRRVVGDRVMQRTALDSDALGVDVRLARAEMQRATLVNAAAGQKEQLNQLLGRAIDTPFEVAGVPGGDPGAEDAAAAHARALESRPDVRQARVRLQQAEISRRRARAEFMPDVSLALSYLTPMNIDGAPRNIASAGVQLQWEPFDWGRRSRTVAARALEVQQATHAVSDEEDRARMEINAALRSLAEARAALRVAMLGQDAARETSRVRQAQYRMQSALLADVFQAAASQADADDEYLRALAAMWSARAELERVIGED